MHESQNKKGAVVIQGGIVHCPCASRSWTVSLLSGVLKLYCVGCKRCFILLGKVFVNSENIK